MENLFPYLFGAVNILIACFTMHIVALTYVKRFHAELHDAFDVLLAWSFILSHVFTAIFTAYYSQLGYESSGMWGLAKVLVLAPPCASAVYLVLAVMCSLLGGVLGVVFGTILRVFTIANSISDVIVTRLGGKRNNKRRR